MGIPLRSLALSLAISAALLPCAALRAQALRDPYPWLGGRTCEPLSGRFAPPPGYARTAAADGSFASWLRSLPLKPGMPPVLLFDGSEKRNRSAHAAVIDMDVGTRDLQQCADTIIRLRAEWLRAAGRGRDVCFRFTDGRAFPWSGWREGGYRGFRAYLTRVFAYAGTASLARELAPVADQRAVEAGDVFIKGGFPGHAVLVVDTARAPGGGRVFLVAQSYMPAQEAHVLRNPGDASLSPWYRPTADGSLSTPEWTFAAGSLRRFYEKGCPPTN
jgi:hypothetical protein